MAGRWKVLFKQVLCLDLYETGWGSVRAGEYIASFNLLVHDQMHCSGFRENGTEDCSGSNFYTGQFPEVIRTCKRDPGNAELSAEFLGYEWFVVRSDIKVKFCLLTVA